MSERIGGMLLFFGAGLMIAASGFFTLGERIGAAEPPALNPFGPATSQREDAVPGYIEMSDGTVYPGQIYLTRDKRLEIFDGTLRRQREVPLRAVKQVECKVLREWMEKEWKFKELASDEKMYTGRRYPAREYVHVITLHDDRTITGPLSAVVYVQPVADSTGPLAPAASAERYLLNKRNKGEIGDELESMVYVKWIKLGEEALAEGQRKAAGEQPGDSPPPETTRPTAPQVVPPDPDRTEGPDDLDKTEQIAASKLRLAKLLAAGGKVDVARERYLEIVRFYPGTKAAEEARRLLAE